MTDFLALAPADQAKELCNITEHALTSHGQEVLALVLELLHDCPRCMLPVTQYLVDNPKIGFSRIKALTLHLDAELMHVFLSLVDDSQPMLRALSQCFQSASPTEKRQVMEKLASLLQRSTMKEFKIMVRGNMLLDFLNNSGDYVKELLERLDAVRYKVILKRLIQDYSQSAAHKNRALSIWSKLLKFVPTMEPQKIRCTQSLFRDVDCDSHHSLELQIEIVSRIKVALPKRLKVGDAVQLNGRDAVIAAMKIVSNKNRAGKRVVSADWEAVHSVANNVILVLDDGTVSRGNAIKRIGS